MENNDGILKKMFGSLGLGSDDDDDMELDDVQEEVYEKRTKKPEKSDRMREREEFEEREIETIQGTNKGGKVVSINTSAPPKVILKKPKEMEDMMEVVDAVKSRKIAVVNLLDVDLPLAQRMIDYVGGACYAINGKFAQISHLVYIVVGENVDLTNYIKTEVNKQSADAFSITEE
ncbi:cell division protein SepF [Clostridium cylindrosporum]|uniref:Cell division protein SepF n=1 Tax=Clostridium cylindrosporum DSM 605 TaxID=1121307 RepID=A0A0J8G0X6_CLOCY|nr:cell division protein SepF [Clostridium cylindrosporum]KMT21431.1 cell division protein SepF [Clostridium cylindrosporum DSM 605]